MKINLITPPIVIEDDISRPLASIPLSELMKERVFCPICGHPLPIDTSEKIIDGSIFIVCKKCK